MRPNHPDPGWGTDMHMKRQKKRRLLFSLCGVLLIGIAAIFIVLLRNSRQQNAASVQNMQLTNIGAFHFNAEYESLALPGGLSGTGIKVSAYDTCGKPSLYA